MDMKFSLKKFITAGFGLTGTIASKLTNQVESNNNVNRVILTYAQFGNITVESW